MRICLTLALLGVAAPLSASEWWYLTEGKDQAVVFVDTETLTIASPNVTFWKYVLYHKSKYVSQKSHETVNCAKKTNSTSTIVTYYQDGTSNAFKSNDPAMDIVPETTGDAMAKFVCASPAGRQKYGIKLNLSPEVAAANIWASEEPEVPPK